MSDQDYPGNQDNSSGNISGNSEPGNISNSNDVWTKGPEIKEQPKPSGSQSASLSGGDGGGNGGKDAGWERDVLNRLAFASLNEQRRARRWSIFFKSLLFVYLFAVLFYIPSDWEKGAIPSGKHTALVDLNGVIASNTQANADALVAGLRDAFKNKGSVAVILRINSPGGSPVQAGYVYDEIKRLRKEYPGKKLYAVVEDICASGGYYIAAAADEIYADKASIVGSIGVLMDGFGFVKSLEKLGIERRLMTAGDHKGILDPFSPLKKDEVKHVQGLLDTVHQQFINKVKEGRGDRLADSPDLFSGLFWNGEEGLKLGLVDGLGSSGYVAREIIGEEKIVDYTYRQNYFDRVVDRLGSAMANTLATTIGLGPAGMR